MEAQAATGTNTESTTAPRTALRRPHHLFHPDMPSILAEERNRGRTDGPEHGSRKTAKGPGANSGAFRDE
ncbi:hypothetical protein Nm8I071_10530 [Nonomuraea sp. TT08I-71]|nr:hypothetical protein Nm8I071_10530 [Nonomuraea sp. TT08I-71]